MQTARGHAQPGAGSREPQRPGTAAWVGVVAAGLAFAGLAVLLSLYKSYSIDEFTYAHLSWSIAHGELPYRDVFFHHPPLIEQLGAIVFWLGGDDPTHIIYLRVLMWPFLALAWVAAWRINREHGRLAAALAPTLMLAVFVYATMATELRGDSAAFALLLSALAVLRARRPGARTRAAAAGALVIASVWASEKVLLYGCPFALALVLDLTLHRRRRDGYALGHPGSFLAGAAAACVPPAVYLTLTASWPSFYAMCVEFPIEHERRYPGFPWTTYFGPFAEQSWWLAPLAAVGVWRTVRALGRTPTRHPDALFLALLPTAFASFAIQKAAYPYSLIPFAGLLAIFAARGLVDLHAALGGEEGLRMPAARAALSVLIAGLLALDLTRGVIRAGQPSNAYQHSELATLARLTEPDDPVYDNSGSSVARPHVSYYYFTDATVRRTQADRLIREVPNQIYGAGCTVMIADLRMAGLPDPLYRFLLDHFLPYDHDIWIWGRSYRHSGSGESWADFQAPRTARYFVDPPQVLERGNLTIDGVRIEQPVFELARGSHDVRYSGAPTYLSILWLPADGRPFSPIAEPHPHFSQLM